MAAPFSPGGNRAYTLTDIISILNQDISNAAQPDLALDTAYTLYVPVNETMRMADTTTPVVVPTKSLVGVIDRQGFPPFSSTSPYMNVLSGYVVNANWKDLQPTSFGAIVGGNAIDTALAAVATQMAVGGQTRQWGLKIRILTGENAPSWAQAQGGGPINGTNASSGNPCTMGPWWTAEWMGAWQDFMTKLAALYDTNPVIRQVVCAHAGTEFAEPLTKNDYSFGSTGSGNANALLHGVYSSDWTWALDQASHETASAFMPTVWKNTPVSVAFNPADVINTNTADVTFTQALMDYRRAQVTQPLCVQENDSLRANGPIVGGVVPVGLFETIDSAGNVTDGHGTTYSTMYTHLMAMGVKAVIPVTFPNPISIQTSTYSKMGNTPQSLMDTLNYAIALGARQVELPSGYSALTSTQLDAFNPGLLGNEISYNVAGGGEITATAVNQPTWGSGSWGMAEWVT